ncbi:hypothetical protein GGR57DRAFT_496375 [Xylariaceae sp. FL1272]|nr:hypothetical protein GGR57DRAFT_496375 [Xylariaceae sp. FL1272]
MLSIADKAPSELEFFAFSNLPPEIRHRIYDFYLKMNTRGALIVPKQKKSDCDCCPHMPPAPTSKTLHLKTTDNTVHLDLAFTCSKSRDEVLGYFCKYHVFLFHFSCACSMAAHLTSNALLKESLVSVQFHWCGLRADLGILQLAEMQQLKNLRIVVSKATSNHLTSREDDIRRFFSKRGHAGLTESLGWDELSKLRLQAGSDVQALHIDKGKAQRRTDDEVHSLTRTLHEYLLPSGSFYSR